MKHEEALAVFEKELRRKNRSPVTIKILLATARCFLRFAKAPITEVAAEDVRRYLASRGKSVAVTTTAAELWHLRGFFRALVDAELLGKNPVDGVTTKRGKHPPQLLLGEHAIRKLLASASDRPRPKGPHARAIALRDRAVLEVLYGVGARVSEVCKLQVVDLSLAEASIVVRRSKGGQTDRLPLPPSAVTALARYLDSARPGFAHFDRDKGALFLAYTGRPLERSHVWGLVSNAGKAAGLRAYPHALRRALATGLVRAGASVRAVQILLGHQSLETTQRYVGVDRKDLRAAIATLEWLPD